MEDLKSNAKAFFVLTACFVTFVVFNSQLSFSQSKLTSIEKGKYELGAGNTGSADYSYYNEDAKRIFDGPFYYNSSKKDSFDIDSYISLELFGDFDKGLKDGEWTFSKSKLRFSGEPTGVTNKNYSLHVAAAGFSSRVSGSFNNGSATGPWSSGQYIIDNGNVLDTTSFIRANFNMNAFEGTFSGYNNQLGLSGWISENGFLNGSWVIYHNNGTVKEERVYDEGILVKHIITKDNVEFIIQHIGVDKESDSLIEVSISSDYLDIIYQSSVLGSQQGSSKLNVHYSKNIIAKSNRFIEESFRSFTTYESIDLWGSTPGGSSLILPKLRVKKFPYSLSEQSQLVQFSELLGQSNELVDSFLLDPQVFISIHSNEEIAYHYAVLSEYRTELNKLIKINDLLGRPSFEFVDRSKILSYLAESIEFPSEVSFSFDEEQKTRGADFPNGLDSKDFSITSVFELMKEINNKLVAEKELFNPELLDLRMVAEIADKDIALLQKRDSIINFFGNNRRQTDFNSFHERYAEEVINFTERRFTNYAKKSIENRVQLIENEIACFETILVFYRVLAKLPRRLEEVKELYTRTVWNPFTFTDMQEVVKERVFSSYEKSLLPYVLRQLDGAIECELLASQMENLTALFSKMKSLRAQDTQELESKLKRTSSVEEVLNAFGLNLYSSK